MKNLYTTLLSLSLSFVAGAQDMNFSQFYELPMLRNPALAGSFEGDIRVTAAYRQQWASVTTPYTSQVLGVDVKFAAGESSDNYFALGLQLTNDMAGDSKFGRTQVLPAFTYHKSLSAETDTYLSLGFMGGPVQNRFDPSGLRFGDQYVNGAYDPGNPTAQNFTNTNVNYFDGAVGMVFSTSLNENVNYYIGASYFHVTKPDVGFAKTGNDVLPKKLMVNAGLTATIGDYNAVTVYTDYFTQGGYRQMQGGFMYRHDLVQLQDEEGVSMSAGMFLRWNDAAIPMLKLNYYKFGLGFTYDVNISKLKTASRMRGGFEATLSYRNFLNIRNSSSEKTRCPKLF